MTVFYVILVILILIFAIIEHEAGHFFAAKAVGIKASHFSIGFGPEIVGWTRGETRYAIKWIMAGGSVKIVGMTPEEEIPEEDLPRSYINAPYWKRTIVILAGSVANILLAFVIFYALMLGWGLPHQQNLKSSRVQPAGKYYIIDKKRVETPAFKVGIKDGDQIIAVNGVPVRNWDDITKQLSDKPGQTVSITIKRGNEVITVRPTLLSVSNGKTKRGVIGIEPYQPIEHFNALTALWGGLKYMGLNVAAIGKGLASLFTVGNLKVLIGTKQPPINSPQSIYGGARLAVEAAKRGIDVFLAIMGSIILVIAIFNLLPLPPLDGGHLLVIVVERFFHKEVNMRKFAMVAWVVIIILSIVALRLFILDIVSPRRLPAP